MNTGASDFEYFKAALRDRFAISSEIRRTGLTLVLEAQDPQLDRVVWLNVLRPEFAPVVGCERFMRLNDIRARLEHPCIVPLLDIGAKDELLYYVTPRLDGELLWDRLRREPQLPLALSLRIASDIGSALGHAHRQGLIHREVDPGSIFLERDRALLSEFPITHLCAQLAPGDDEEDDFVVFRSPGYMSPEQAFGEQVDGRTDVYSLGCVLFEMLVGRPVFGGPMPTSLVLGQVKEIGRTLEKARPEIPKHIRKAIEKALAKEPRKRHRTIDAFVDALGA